MSDTAKEELIPIEGVVESVIYNNEQNGYSVIDLAISEAEFVTLTGIMPYVSEGETMKAMGRWEIHPTFGRQFKVEYYEKTLPANESAILKYLSSRAVKGIGPVTAGRIVDKFGADSFDVIENHPDWLSEIPGISVKKAQEISADFRAQFGMRNVMAFCGEFMGPAAAVRVYKAYGSAAIDIIKQDPYVLCENVRGISFEKADRIARSLGLPQDSPQRIRAGIIHTLKYNASSNGHVYLPKEKMLAVAAELLEVSGEQTRAACDELIELTQVKQVKLGGRECIYLKYYYDAEMAIGARLDRLNRVCSPVGTDNTMRFIERLEMEFGVKYAPMQKKAIACALENGVTILTGGPGTGKTTIIRALIRVFDSLGLNVALAAPTGRAAKRMSEATQCEARTIHRLLEIDFSKDDEPSFRRNEENYLDEDVFIIDETSMIDTGIMAALVKAIKPGARLMLIGDSDQLPSVGPGNVLRDIIDSSAFVTVELKEVFRQASESLIITNAHCINAGEYPELESKNSDFFFLPRNDDTEIANTVASLCVNRLPKTYGKGILSGLQVITPSRKGAAGTIALNALLQGALNPPDKSKRERKFGAVTLREGDKVMQIRNNYDIEWTKGNSTGVGIFNGDIGVIEDINIAAEKVHISFDGRVAEYDFTQLEEIEHAYAVTVHKSQGSEYPTVIIPVYSYAPRLLTRNLLYTAVTRAQNMVILVGRADVVMGMVDNNRQTNRYTGLKHILQKYAAIV